MRFVAFGCLVLLLAVSLVAAAATEIDGKWTAQTLMGPSGSEQAVPTTFTFRMDGDELTGTVSSPKGEFEIQDGKINGDSITFTIMVTSGSSGFKMMYDGRITTDGIDFIVKVEGRDRSDHFIATRPSA